MFIDRHEAKDPGQTEHGHQDQSSSGCRPVGGEGQHNINSEIRQSGQLRQVALQLKKQ